jgi:hypothetical protein
MNMEFIEKLWENILSREANLIKSAYDSLADEEKQQVVDHLKIMISESGWQKEQQISAAAALEVINKNIN